MPIAVTCTDCQTGYQLPDAMRGQSFRCDQCQANLTVGSAAPPSMSVTAAPAPYSAAAPAPYAAPRIPDVRLRKQGSATLIVAVVLASSVVMMSCVGVAALWLLPLSFSSAPATAAAAPPLAMQPVTRIADQPIKAVVEVKPPVEEPIKLVGEEKVPPGQRNGVVTWANYQRMIFGISETRVRAILGPPTKTLDNMTKPNFQAYVWEENGQFIRLGFADGRLSYKHSLLRPGPDDRPFEVLTREQYDKITPGMALDDVKDLIGGFRSSQGNRNTAIFTATWVDPVNHRAVTLVLKDNKVTAKRSSEAEWGGFDEGKK